MSMPLLITFVVWAVILFYVYTRMKKTNTKPRDKGPGKVQRIIFGVSGATLITIVVWCTVRDCNSLYKNIEANVKISMPTIKVEKIKTDHPEFPEKGHEVDYRILTQVFAVREETGELLLFSFPSNYFAEDLLLKKHVFF